MRDDSFTQSGYPYRDRPNKIAIRPPRKSKREKNDLKNQPISAMSLCQPTSLHHNPLETNGSDITNPPPLTPPPLFFPAPLLPPASCLPLFPLQ